MNVGERIKKARIAKGLTQEELGELLGVQKSAVAKYENGRVVNIKRSTLKKIADVLDIPPFELVYEGKDPVSNGVSIKRQALIDFAMSVPEDKAEMILRVMKSILQDD